MVATLRTFGTPLLFAESRAEGAPHDVVRSVLLRPGKPLAVLAFLAASPGRTASRAHLVDLLWSDVEQERGLRTLRQTLFQLRHVLGEHMLEADSRAVTLSATLDCDRDRFLAAIARNDAPAAMAIRTAPFLDDFAVPGGAEFELWAELERARLDSLYLRLCDGYVRERIAAGDVETAVRSATALRSAMPTRETIWRLLLEAQLAAGAWSRAAAEIDAFNAWLTSEDRQAEPATVALIRRATRVAESSPSGDNASAPAGELRASLIGRTREFAALLRAADQARRGRRQYVHVEAAAGGGKSRLLRETRARLRAMGQRVVFIQGTPGDQSLALSFAADTAMALAALPGAAGMSTEGAAVLVGLAPALSNIFPTASSSPHVDVSRVALALTELLSVVSDERPVALLIDDLHWTDDTSRNVLRAALQRASSAPLLIVGASRPGTPPLVAVDPIVLELPPLTAEEVEALMRDMAVLPDEPWIGTLLGALAKASAGNPLLLLETLRLAGDRGALRIVEGMWTCADRSMLDAILSGGEVLRTRLDSTDDAERTLLLLLAVRGTPTAWSLVLDTGLVEERAMRDAAERLTRRGLVHRDVDSLALAHDRLATVIVDHAPAPAVIAMHRALGLALARRVLRMGPQSEDRVLERAVAHLMVAGETGEVNQLALIWVRHRRGIGDRRPVREILRDILGTATTEHTLDRLESALPFTLRRRRMLVAALVLLLFTTGGALHVLNRPASIAVIASPIASGPTMVPAPTVQVLDGMGRLRASDHDTVWISASSGVTLSGDTVAVTQAGRAVFRKLRGDGKGSGSLRYRVGRTGSTLVESPMWFGGASAGSDLHLVSGTINGVSLDPANPDARVRLGDSVRADLVVRYTSRWAAASVMLGATGTWGNPEEAFTVIEALVTPAMGTERRVRFTLPLPMRADSGALILAFQAEDNIAQVMSGTNWTVGRLAWRDGNDVAGWSPELLRAAQRDGRVLTTVLRGWGYSPQHVPATVVWIRGEGVR